MNDRLILPSAPAPEPEAAAFVPAESAFHCSECKHFHATEATRRVGQCRRMPPAPVVVGVRAHPVTQQPMPVVDGYFPAVSHNNWCGEFSAAKKN